MIYSFHNHSSPLNALSKIDGINVDKPNPLLPPPAGGGVPAAFGRMVGVENSRVDIIPLWDASRAVCMSLRAPIAKQSPLETGDCFAGKPLSRNDIIISTFLAQHPAAGPRQGIRA